MTDRLEECLAGPVIYNARKAQSFAFVFSDYEDPDKKNSVVKYSKDS